MRVKSVKCLKTGTSVIWETDNGRSTEGHDLKDCPDPITPEMGAALEDVRSLAVSVLGVDVTKYELTGASKSKDAGGHVGYVLTGKLTCKAGVSALNTPRLRAPVGNETGANVLNPDQAGRIEKLLAQAGEYATGERAQTEIKVEA